MIFIQTLYGIILEDLIGVELGAVSKNAMSQMLSSQRKHRSLRTWENKL